MPVRDKNGLFIKRKQKVKFDTADTHGTVQQDLENYGLPAGVNVARVFAVYDGAAHKQTDEFDDTCGGRCNADDNYELIVGDLPGAIEIEVDCTAGKVHFPIDPSKVEVQGKAGRVVKAAPGK